jgi:amidase
MTSSIESNNNEINAFSNDILGTMDGFELSKRIDSGEICSLELVKASILRAEKFNPKLNAIVTKTFEKALSDADKSVKGIFSGLPSFIKDNTDVAGVPSQNGSSAIRRNPVLKSSKFVNQFTSTGLISLGKSAMPEFGLTATTEPLAFGPTRNPWNSDFSAGGSSGGSAVLVASGVVPIAHANDGGGSIRIPAACCGLVGLKPSRSRLINMKGTEMLPVNIVHHGVVSRTVRDTALFYSGAEKYYKNANLPEIGLVTGPGKKRLKIGLFTDTVDGTTCDPEIIEAVHSVGKECQKHGHKIEEISYPFSKQMGDDFILYWGMMAFSIKYFGGIIIGRGFNREKVETLTSGLATHFRKNIFKTPFIIKRLKKFLLLYEEIFNNYDILLSPVLAHEPPKLGYLGPELPFEIAIERLEKFVPFTPAQNISGAPAISIPSGYSSKNGLPIGIQFAAGEGQEKILLELAFEMETAKSWSFIGGK